MPFHVQFYIFDKHRNSTARPVGKELFAMLGTLKEASGIRRGRIGFHLPADFQDVGNYNYAYIKLWRRFYYLSEWTYDNSMWYATFREDSLASWRDEIGALEVYVTRSSQLFDGSIMDYVYPAKASLTKYANGITTDFKRQFSEGSYVLGVIGGNGGDLGAVSYYVMDVNRLHLFMELLTENNPSWMNLPKEIIQTLSGSFLGDTVDVDMKVPQLPEVLRQQANPIQYVVSCMWYPFQAETGSTENIKIGYWQLPMSAPKLDLGIHASISSVKVPKHPQSASRGSYLNMSPFSRYVVRLGQFGTHPIDSVKLLHVSNIDIQIVTDCVTGKAKIRLDEASNTSGQTILEAEGVVGVPIQLAQITRDYFQAASTALYTATGSGMLATLNQLGSAIAGAISGIGDATTSLMPELETKGNNGSIVGNLFNWELQSEHLTVVDEDRVNKGRPLCQIQTVNVLGGYMECNPASVHLPCTDEELEEIRQFMERGFYWK